MKMTVNFSKEYEEQTKAVKNAFCEQDYNKIRNLLNFKEKYKKSLTK